MFDGGDLGGMGGGVRVIKTVEGCYGTVRRPDDLGGIVFVGIVSR